MEIGQVDVQGLAVIYRDCEKNGSSGIHVAAKAAFFRLLGMRLSPPRWNRMAIRKRFRLRNPHAIFFTH
jgi:hypothetical protein